MAAQQKRKQAETVEEDAPVSDMSKLFDEVTYVPGHGDRPVTKWNGIEFRANVAVRIPRNKCVMAPVKQESQLPDGSIVTRAIERRIPMVELARGNPVFMVNGVKPKKREGLDVRLPVDANSYRSYAIRWIAGCNLADEMIDRWNGEQKLRDRCGVDAQDLHHILPFFEARKMECEGELVVDSPLENVD